MLIAQAILTTAGELQRDYLYAMQIVKDPIAKSEIAEYDFVKENLDIYSTKGLFPGRKAETIQLKWAGQSVMYAGVDGSTKSGSITFRCDEAHKIYNFWCDFKNLTGNEKYNVKKKKSSAIFDFLIHQVSVDKETITASRMLERAQVMEVSDLSVDKEGTNVSTFTVTIAWDENYRDYTYVGKKV